MEIPPIEAVYHNPTWLRDDPRSQGSTAARSTASSPRSAERHGDDGLMASRAETIRTAQRGVLLSRLFPAGPTATPAVRRRSDRGGARSGHRRVHRPARGRLRAPAAQAGDVRRRPGAAACGCSGNATTRWIRSASTTSWPASSPACATPTPATSGRSSSRDARRCCPFLVEAYGSAGRAALHRLQDRRRPVADRQQPVLPARRRDPLVERGADGPRGRPARRRRDRRASGRAAGPGAGVDDLARAAATGRRRTSGG